MRAPQKTGDSLRVCPYFSAFAGLALLLRPGQYAGAVRRYVEWHLGRLNTARADYNGVDGTIYDYVIALPSADGMPHETIMTGKGGKPYYDSTDAYAALFLMLARAYHTAAGDGAYLRANGGALVRVYRAMCATMDGGLSNAKPDWPVKYLMDNSEVMAGLSAAEALFRALGTQTGGGPFAGLPGECAARRERIAEEMERRLWDERAGVYRVGIDARGRPVPAAVNLRRFYPDAMAQLFAIMMGVIPPESARARRLYAEVNRHFSSGATRWEEMRGLPKGTRINGILVRTAARMGDEARVRRYMEAYAQNVLDAGHPDGQNAECAHVALAAGALLGMC